MGKIVLLYQWQKSYKTYRWCGEKKTLNEWRRKNYGKIFWHKRRRRRRRKNKYEKIRNGAHIVSSYFAAYSGNWRWWNLEGRNLRIRNAYYLLDVHFWFMNYSIALCQLHRTCRVKFVWKDYYYASYSKDWLPNYLTTSLLSTHKNWCQSFLLMPATMKIVKFCWMKFVAVVYKRECGHRP